MWKEQSIWVRNDQTYSDHINANILGSNQSAKCGKWKYTVWFETDDQKLGYELTKPVKKLKNILGYEMINPNYETTSPWVRNDQTYGRKRPRRVQNVKVTERPAFTGPRNNKTVFIQWCLWLACAYAQSNKSIRFLSSVWLSLYRCFKRSAKALRKCKAFAHNTARAFQHDITRISMDFMAVF